MPKIPASKVLVRRRYLVDCTWALAHGRGVPLPGQPLDTVPAGMRLVLYRGE